MTGVGSRGPFACPACRLRGWGSGFCPRCGEFTGLCGAGRRLQLPAGIVFATAGPDWSGFCADATRDGDYWRVITLRGEVTDTWLCASHGAAAEVMAAARMVRAWRIPAAPPLLSRQDRLARALQASCGPRRA